jgi:hypothetical protein
MLFPFQFARRARIAAGSWAVDACDYRKRIAPTCPDCMAQFGHQNPSDIHDPADWGKSALRCLFAELGQAARAGWAPTIRWIALLLSVAIGVALVMAVWK